MSIFKKISKKPWGTRLIARLVEGYVRFVWLTSRWDVHDGECFDKVWAEDKPLVGVFWHSRLLMILKFWKGHKLHMLISNHSDGAFIAKATQAFGYGWVVGSSNRQGTKAVRNLLDVLEKGESIGITPDGPRGPRYQAKISSITVARMAGVDIYPVTYSAKRGIFFRSWDRFFLPFPFNKGVYVCGVPVRVSTSNKTDEELRLELEESLNNATRKADALCGWTQTNPGDVPTEKSDCELVA